MRRTTTCALYVMFACSALAASGAPVPRPPITGIAWVRFAGLPGGGSDTFYLNELGIPRVMSGDTSIFLLSPTQSIQVVPRPPEPGNQLLKIALYTTSLDQMRAYLASKGVASANDADGLEVLDPEGHPLVFRAAAISAPATRGYKDNQVSHRLIHAGIIVHDRAAEDGFYRDILGCRLYWQGGNKDGVTDWVNMQVPDGSDWIEYMLHVPADADAGKLGSANHISLGVQDIQATAKLLTANGWHAPQGGGTRLGVDGKWQISLRDPLNSRVEVMEYTPVRPPCCSPFTGTTPHD